MSIIQKEYGASFDECSSYQQAFSKLTRVHGVDEANRLIRKIVLQARLDHREIIRGIDLNDNEKLQALEEETDKWIIPKGLHALAALRAHFPKKVAGKILTTNFDPLIEIAFERQFNSWYSTALHADGSLLYLIGSGSHIIHLHGRWCGSDTLHTPEQLTDQRPQLESSLRTILTGSTLVVIGYGGWDDVITNTLERIISENNTRINLLWGFYDRDEKNILNRQENILKKLAAARPIGRVQFYKGADANSVLVESFRIAVGRKPAQDIETFMNIVQLQRTRQISYHGLADPWDGYERSLGYFIRELSKFSIFIAAKGCLYGLTYLLPTLEEQGIHQPVVRNQYSYIRRAMNLCLQSLNKDNTCDSETHKWLRDSMNRIQEDSRKDTKLSVPLVSAALAIDAALMIFSQKRDDDTYSSETYNQIEALVSRSIHGFSRALHNDDGALWAYITLRLAGGHDHLSFFNSKWQDL